MEYSFQRTSFGFLKVRIVSEGPVDLLQRTETSVEKEFLFSTLTCLPMTFCLNRYPDTENNAANMVTEQFMWGSALLVTPALNVVCY